MYHAGKDCFLSLILVVLILICGVGGVGQGKAIQSSGTNISSHIVAGGEITGTAKARSSKSSSVSSNETSAGNSPILSVSPGNHGSSRTHGFLRYNNTYDGYSVQYPSDWSAPSVQTNRQLFGSPDHVAQVDISILTSVPNGTSLEDVTRIVVGAESVYPLEINTNTYLLSGHPAVRIIELGKILSPSHAEARVIEPGKPYKGMRWLTIVDNTVYMVAYAASPPERFPDYLRTAQMIANSFQITNKSHFNK